MMKRWWNKIAANESRKKWDIRYIVSCSIWIETIIKSRALTIYQQKLLYLKYMANKQNTSISSHKYAIYKEGRWHSAYCWLPFTKGNNENPICFYLRWCCKENQQKIGSLMWCVLQLVTTPFLWSSDKKRWWKTHQ